MMIYFFIFCLGMSLFLDTNFHQFSLIWMSYKGQGENIGNHLNTKLATKFISEYKTIACQLDIEILMCCIWRCTPAWTPWDIGKASLLVSGANSTRFHQEIAIINFIYYHYLIVSGDSKKTHRLFKYCHFHIFYFIFLKFHS